MLVPTFRETVNPCASAAKKSKVWPHKSYLFFTTEITIHTSHCGALLNTRLFAGANQKRRFAVKTRPAVSVDERALF